LDVLEHAFVASCGRVLDPNTTAVEPNTPLVLGATSAEDEFYNAYSWCLNAFPTFAEVIIHLSEELHKFAGVQAHWQESELITNIFLLSCSLTDSIDDFVAGSTYDFAKLRRALPRAAPAIGAIEQVLRATGRLRIARFVRLQQWRRLWASAVTDFLQHSAVAPGF